MGPANDGVHDNVYGCYCKVVNGCHDAQISAKLVGCQASQVIRICTSRNRNAIFWPLSMPTCPLLYHYPESEEHEENICEDESVGKEL